MRSRRSPLVALSLIAALATSVLTCNQDHGTAPTGPEGAEVGLLALDLERLASALEESDRLPAEVEIFIDNEALGHISLPTVDGLLAGHATVAVPADETAELTLTVRTRDGIVMRAPPHEVALAEGELLRLPVAVDEDRLVWRSPRRFLLPPATNLAVYFRDLGRESVIISELPAAPARAIASILADPQTASVIPFTADPSETDEVGALVGIPAPRPAAEQTAVLEKVVTPTDGVALASAATVAPAPVTIAVPPESKAPRDSAPTSSDDYIYYYSYCTCGKPVPDRQYTLSTKDGRTFEGKTDRFGMVLHPGVMGGRIDFGKGQRQRERGYPYQPGTAEMHAAMLANLGSSIAKDQLTALLDLRKEPLEDARETLEALLDHPEQVAWLNAAVTLSHYAEIDGVVHGRLAILETLTDDAAISRELAILGALRHTAAGPPLAGFLVSTSADHRALAAWALGFIGQESGRAPLAAALGDDVPSVVTEVKAALARLDLHR